MTNWPDTLPAAPLAEGFRESAPHTAIRTEMDQGIAKVRQRATTGIRKMAMAFVLGRAQVAILDGFFTETVAGGSLPFGFFHPRTGESVICRFRQPPEYASLNGEFFRAAIELEILP